MSSMISKATITPHPRSLLRRPPRNSQYRAHSDFGDTDDLRHIVTLPLTHIPRIVVHRIRDRPVPLKDGRSGEAEREERLVV